MNHSLVLDTNVLVSAAIHLDGPPGFLVQAILRQELACFTCPSVVEEYWDVLTRPKFARLGFPPPWFEPLLEEARHLEADPPTWPLEGPDPEPEAGAEGHRAERGPEGGAQDGHRDDLVFLALAHLTGAVLVTGNLADYPEAIRRGVQVMSPREYLEGLA